MLSDGTILQCVMHVHYTCSSYWNINKLWLLRSSFKNIIWSPKNIVFFFQFLEQSPGGADKTVHSVDLDSSTLDQSTAFLESFKMGGYDEMTQVKDLHVTVDDPEKHVGGYVSYNVITKVLRLCKNIIRIIKIFKNLICLYIYSL